MVNILYVHSSNNNVNALIILSTNESRAYRYIPLADLTFTGNSLTTLLIITTASARKPPSGCCATAIYNLQLHEIGFSSISLKADGEQVVINVHNTNYPTHYFNNDHNSQGDSVCVYNATKQGPFT